MKRKIQFPSNQVVTISVDPILNKPAAQAAGADPSQ